MPVSEALDKRQEQRETRRRQIVDAATQVFAGKGFHAANVSDVAARAGVSQGTIYWYFESKESLFTAVLEQATQDSARLFLALAEEESTEPLARVQRVIRRFLAQIQDPPDSFRLLVNLWTQPAALASEPATEIVRKLYNTLMDGFLIRLVQDAMDACQIAPGDARAIALVLVTVLDGLMFQSMLFPEMRVESDEIERALMRLLCGSPSGPESR